MMILYFPYVLYICYLEFFCKEIMPLTPHLLVYSIMYVYQGELMNIYFILWVII